MAYIGRGTDNISNVEVLDNITFNGNSSYTLQKGGANFVPVSANNILLSIDGVVQANNFSVSGSTIDFGTAVTGTCNFVLHFGTGLITTVQDGAVTTAKIGDDAVTYAKLQNLATANRVLGSTSTGLIGETQIATAMVSDDAITYAKMQDTSAANRVLGAVSAGTVGEVQVATDMIADAQVDESKLKISNAPTNGYFLSAQSGNTGGLTWAEAGGDCVKLATGTASAQASISIDGYYTTDYNIYKLYAMGVYQSAQSQDLYFRINIGGSAQSSGDYAYAYRYQGVNSSGSNNVGDTGGWSSNAVPITNNQSSSATYPHCLDITIFDPLSTTARKNYTFHNIGNYNNNSGILNQMGGVQFRANTSAHSGITLYAGGSNTTTMEHWVLYGFKI